MADTDFLSEETAPQAKAPKHVFRLYRRLFVLVFAIAVLWQSLLFVDMRLEQYYRALKDSFKIILTVNQEKDAAALTQLGDTLKHQSQIASVRLFSSQDGLEEVRRQNPQLAQSLLLMGSQKMPAYFEVKLTEQMMGNIRPFADRLGAQYSELTLHYNAQHAELIFYTGLCFRLLRLSMAFAVLFFLIFMFLVEAQPLRSARSHAFSGVVSGALAWGGSAGLFALLVYPTGLLQQSVAVFTTPQRQLLGLVFSMLLGWTLSKWQKF